MTAHDAAKSSIMLRPNRPFREKLKQKGENIKMSVFKKALSFLSLAVILAVFAEDYNEFNEGKTEWVKGSNAMVEKIQESDGNFCIKASAISFRQSKEDTNRQRIHRRMAEGRGYLPGRRPR